MFECQTYCDPDKRLELCFRPKDAGCRPLFGNRHACKGLLLRVRRRRRRQDAGDNSVDLQQVERNTNNTSSMQNASENAQSALSAPGVFRYSAEVIGLVETVYRFQSKYPTVSTALRLLGAGSRKDIRHI